MLNTLYELHKNPLLRRILLPILKRMNPGDIRIRHHYTDQDFLLHSYRHKGYWFHGRRREQETMDFFRSVLQSGDCVIEVGGHIGYLTAYFSQLVGEQGKVVVFEPGKNNLPYLRSNISSLPQVTLIEQAVSNNEGTADFFEEDLTGQNNSLLSDYEVFAENCHRAFATQEYQRRSVETVTLDSFVAKSNLQPRLIKIDIEGAELFALEGAKKLLSEHHPIVMVEVTDKKQEVFNFFQRLGYLIFTDTGRRITAAEQFDFNACALHPNRHRELLQRLGWFSIKAA